MQLANYAYEPGMYEVIGPPDRDLPRSASIREGYLSPSILGFKIRATEYPWLARNPTVTAYLYEGMFIWLAPTHPQAKPAYGYAVETAETSNIGDGSRAILTLPTLGGATFGSRKSQTTQTLWTLQRRLPTMPT